MQPIEIRQFPQPFAEGAASEAKEILARGGVRLQEGATDRFFEAKVPFFRRFHDVWMEIQPDGRIDHECTCPHLENTGTGCAHLYVLFELANQRIAETSEEGQLGLAPLLPTFVLKSGVLGPARVDVLFRLVGDKDTTPRPFEIDGEVLERIDTSAPLDLLLFLLPYAGGKRNRLDGGGFAVPRGPWAIPVGARRPWLRQLTDAGLLCVESSESSSSLVPIETFRADPLTLSMGFRAEGDARVRMEVALLAKGETLPMRGGRIHATDTEALISLQGTLYAVEHFGASEWIRFGIAGKSLPVERARVPALLSELGKSGPLPQVLLPGEESVRLRSGAPTPRARMTTSRGAFRLEVDFIYGGRAVRPEDHERLLLDPQTGEQWRRQLAAESEVLRKLGEHRGLDGSEGILGRYSIDTDPEWMAQDLLGNGFVVELDGRALRRPGPLLVTAKRVGAWLDVEGTVTFGEGEVVRVDALLLALKENRPFVRLSTGALGHLSEDLSTRLQALARMLDRGRGERIPLARAALLDGVLGDAFEPDAGLAPLLRGIAAARAPKRVAPRPTFQGTLRPYQELGVGWITGLAAHGLGGCLADDMGLGKTVQVLAFLERRMEEADKPILIVAPRSVLWNWEQEVRRFLGPLPFVRHYGARRAKAPPELRPARLVLTTYGTLLRDQTLLSDVEFDTVVLDEAQVIRNSSSQTSAAARALNADFRLALTGTPIENRIEDLWSIMEFANPGLLPAERSFAAHMRSTDAHGRSPLVQVLRPLVLRRTKAEVATDLPPKVEQILRAPMEDEQGRLYEALRARASLRVEEATASGGPSLEVLEALLRLRQVACHPGLVDPSLSGAPSGKVLVLMAEVEQLAESGHKCLIFSQFTSFLRLVEARIKQTGIQTAWLDGSTRDRGAAITRFQEDPDCKVFLISLKAGGTGLNLVAADYVFLLDPWWNPAAEDQAADRAHRIGQTKQVFVYRLVSAGTVEERVLSLQADKRAVASQFLESEASAQDLRAEDLRFLLAPEDAF